MDQFTDNHIYDPLEEYENVFRDRFKQVAEETFAQLAKEADIDVEANRETCRNIYENQDALQTIRNKISTQTLWQWLLWTIVIAAAATIFFAHDSLGAPAIAGIAIAAVGAIVLLFVKIYPRLKQLKAERDNLEEILDNLKKQAWQQMEPLNRLYDWDILTRMMTRTVPRLEFDPYFTTQRLADLQEVYGWDDSFNEERSVIYSHSGLINGNPFVICRTRKMEMGSKTYYGSLTIHWTTTEYDSNGNSRTVHHSETLTASVTAPFPGYYEATRLFYGNTAAPDLTFTRQKSGLASKEGSLKFKWKRYRLRQKSRNMKRDYAMLTNEEFEVAFNTSDRNNNQQYALLFTPLAQQSMMALLKDEDTGYGDDFDFDKYRMINVITADHMQELNLDLNPGQYRSFDYDKAENDFYEINAQYFHAIYFCFAPLLCVPMYQQIRPQHDIYGRDMMRRSSFWEHEALANFWGQKHFEHPECATKCILKTTQGEDGDDNNITVYAYGYRVEQRLTYVEKWGGDGRLHDVPVYWDEYLPVTGKGSMDIREDNDPDKSTTQNERLQHISSVLSSAGLDVYRRHIASRVN